MKNTYDTKCFELAKLFLSDVVGLTHEDIEQQADSLAEIIQDTIEDFIDKLDGET